MLKLTLSVFGADLNSCLLDAEAGLLVVRSVELPLYVNVCGIEMYKK